MTDTTLRTIAEARRAPQWARLIDSIHAAQEAQGYPGRQFGATEMQFFGASLVGMPESTPYAADTYWVERQSLEHSDGSVTVWHALKVVRGDALHKVDTIAREELHAPTPDQEQSARRDAIARIRSLAGVA